MLVEGTVRRPRRENSEAVQRFLAHLKSEGCSFVPEPLGFDDQGREVLSFLQGKVPRRPVPRWATTAARLYDIGELLRRFRAAAAAYTPSGSDRWFANPPIPRAFTGAVVGHNDFDYGNIVFSDRKASGIIDFDYAAPSDMVWEVAVAAFYLVPLRDQVDSSGGAQKINERLRAIVDGAGLSKGDRRRLPDAVTAFHAHRLDRARAAGRVTTLWKARHDDDARWLAEAVGGKELSLGS